MKPVTTEPVEVSAGEFNGRFHRFEKKLGRGATKKVFLAYDTERGVDCAWNQISLHSLTEEEQEGLEKEINVMKSLNHENILKYHAHWKTSDFLCFITDYQTHSLKNYINERKVRLATIKKWSRQILCGLHHLHQRKILHRDIKCDNLFLNSQNSTVVIGDLGLAKEMTQATGVNGEPMSIVGTPQFMAPEQLHLESHYDEKVDIYALGMCIIEMITRTYPYSECRTILEVITCINEDRDCLALTRINSANAACFIRFCCHRNPEVRPSASDCISHPWLARTMQEDAHYCSDLVTPLEGDEPIIPKPVATEEQPIPTNARQANAEVSAPNQHDGVDTGPVEDSHGLSRPSYIDENSSSDATRPGVSPAVNQPTAHSANLNAAMQTPTGIVNQNTPVGNQQFPANSQPNHNAFSQYVQPVFNQPHQMGGFMNPMAVPNFPNPMMFMNMNPGMNTTFPPQSMIQQFIQMTQNSNAPGANIDPRMLENWLQQMFQAQATANYMSNQYLQQQWSQFMQQQGYPTQANIVPNSTSVHPSVPSTNGATIPPTPKPTVPGANGATIPTVSSEPRLSATALTPNPIEAPSSNTSAPVPQTNLNAPGSQATTPQPSYNAPTQPFPNSFTAPGAYAAQPTQPAQYKQAPSSTNQQQYQAAPTSSAGFTSPNQVQPPVSAPTQQQFTSPQSQFIQPYSQPQQVHAPTPNAQPMQPQSIPTQPMQPQSIPTQPMQPQPIQTQPMQPQPIQTQPQPIPTQPIQRQSFHSQTPTPAFQQGPFRPEPKVSRQSFQALGTTGSAAMSGSAQSSTSHSPSNSPQIRMPSVRPASVARQASSTSEPAGVSRKKEPTKKCEFADSKIVTPEDPVKVVSVETTDPHNTYYVLRMWKPALNKGKKFGITISDTDDVNDTVGTLLRDHKLPQEWHKRVHARLLAAKETFDRPRMSSSRSETSLAKNDIIPFGDTSRRSSVQHMPSLDSNGAPTEPSDDDPQPTIPILPFDSIPDSVPQIWSQKAHSAETGPLPEVPKRQNSDLRSEQPTIPMLRDPNSLGTGSDPDPTFPLSKHFLNQHNQTESSQSDVINTPVNQPSLVNQQPQIDRVAPPQNILPETPSSPTENSNISSGEIKADPTLSTTQQQLQTADSRRSRPRSDVYNLEEDRPTVQPSPPELAFSAFPASQEELLKRIIYMSRDELFEFCDVHNVTIEGIPLQDDIDENTLQTKVYDHILAERGEKRKPFRRKKKKTKEKDTENEKKKENEKPKARRVVSANAALQSKEDAVAAGIRRASEPPLPSCPSVNKTKPETSSLTNHDAPEMALNSDFGRLCDRSDEDATFMADQIVPDTLLEETNKKDQTQSLADSILELHKFMQMSDSQGNSKDLRRMMLTNLEKLKAHDQSKYEELTNFLDFSAVISPSTNSEPPPVEHVTRPCTEIDANSEDQDSFFIALSYSLNRIGYQPETTAIGIRKAYCRELQTILNHDDASAENLTRLHQKVRKRILRMYKDSKEQALAVLEKFSQPGFWHQHLFDNSKGVVSQLFSIRIRLYMDGFDEDQIVEIGKGAELNEIEIFQERIYEDGVPAFVYRIVDTEIVKQPSIFDGKEADPFLAEIYNDLLSKQEGSDRERKRRARETKMKLSLKLGHSHTTGGSETNENSPRDSPTKVEPIELPLPDDPLDPFQSLISSSIKKSPSREFKKSSLRSNDSTLRSVDSTTGSGKDGSPRESPTKPEPVDPMRKEVPKEKSKPKLTKEQKEERKREKARKRAEIEARIAEEQQRLSTDPNTTNNTMNNTVKLQTKSQNAV